MKRFVLLSFHICLSFLVFSQPGKQPEAPKVYRGTPEKINDLVHTKMDARLDFPKSQLYGKAWITLKPHFYSTDSLRLDAKGMDIKQVAVVKGGKNLPLKYTYDGMQLDIDLDKKYKGGESYTIYIDYTAKPNEFQAEGSAAITDAKGLYFINPTGEEKDKPTQVWTQGETEATSVYVPTIDRPNQKTTQEFILTVPGKFVTLSNGKMISQKKNADGTRTDHWKMDLPHTPYLFFLGAGDFAVVKDSYKGKEVNYYVDKEYASVAKKIFGNTPEMMTFFSKVLGVEYPWIKYAQMTAHDYVSGAMENTTATLHSDAAQQDARQLVDGNAWEDVISHELFHQWFGDLVTTESWSNLSLNESFANYSEYLWREYKYGKDAADEHHYDDMQGYLNSGSEKKDLIRFHYRDKEDMFDAVSYNKGGRILHMLRNFVGDSAFFKTLNNYLNANKFKSAEAHQLRLAFEEVTGKDLNWFFNQWYFNSGHPKLNITYGYNNDTKQASVIVQQAQDTTKTFQLPVTIDVYHGADVMRYKVWVKNRIDTFTFASLTKPDLINFDADKILLTQKTENKTLEEYVHQYKHARNYLDRREAIDAASKKQAEANGVVILMDALDDKYHGLRNFTIGKLDLKKEALKTAVEPELFTIAQKDSKSTVRAAAISKLGDYQFAKYNNFYKTALNDSSYSVAGNALEAISKVDTALALGEAKRLSATNPKGKLGDAISKTLIKYGDESSADAIIGNFVSMPLSQAKFEALQPLSEFLAKLNSFDQFKRGVDAIEEFHKQIPSSFRDQVTPFIEGLYKNIQKAKTDKGQKEHADYAGGKLNKEGKKDF